MILILILNGINYFKKNQDQTRTSTEKQCLELEISVTKLHFPTDRNKRIPIKLAGNIWANRANIIVKKNNTFT